MTKMIEGSAAGCDADAFAVEAAEADFILAVQTEIQKVLNDKGLRARDLAKRLDVSEARISQMFGEQAKNLTLRTIARIFHHLGETAYITTLNEFHRASNANIRSSDGSQDQWTVSTVTGIEDLQVANYITLGQAAANFDSLPADKGINRWARAEEAEDVKPRRLATVR